MNILDKIKKNWNHKESVEQNVLRFNNEQEQRQRKIKKLYPLFIFLFILACLVFPINPLVGMCLMIGTLSFGSTYAFSSTYTTYPLVKMLDSTHFVVFYYDYLQTNKGVCVIGTIAENGSISYGTKSSFTSAEGSYQDLIVLDSTHFVITYKDGYIYYRCGEVSGGNTITFGTAKTKKYDGGYKKLVRIDSTHFVGVGPKAATHKDLYSHYCSISGKEISIDTETAMISSSSYGIVVSSLNYIDSTHFLCISSDGSDSSNYPKAFVCTISSGTVSIGSKTTVFEKDNRVASKMYDSTHFIATTYYGGKVVKIGTISSGNISFGSDIEFNSADVSYKSIVVGDSTHFIITYLESSVMKAKVGTIDGSSISFSSATTIGNAKGYCFSSDILSDRFINSFQNSSDYGAAVLGTYTTVVAPTVTTQSADQIATTSVRGNGNITATGGENCTRRGFCYKAGTSGDPTTSDSVAYDDGSFGTGAFAKIISGLTPNTSYRVRAYAVNSAGTSYGTTVQVTTLKAFKPRTMWF